MSLCQGKVVRLILLERFGEIVADIGRILFSQPSSLYHVKKSTDFPLLKIKEALSILIKFNLVTYKSNTDGGAATYRLRSENVLLMLRYPKFINLIKKKMDEEAETLVEELLYKGCCIASELIVKTATRLKENKDLGVLLKQIKDKFASLVTAKYFIRLPTKEMKEEDHFLLPNIELKELLSLMQSGNLDNPADESIYWTINVDRFHQDLRDQVIVTAASNKFDENAGELMRVFLQQMYIRTSPWVAVSNPVPILEVKDIVKKQNTHPQLLAFFEQYVNVLEQDSNQIITKVGEASGGSYQIEMKHIFKQLVWETIENIVNEKFDREASRIFRLIKSRSYIEPEQIQKIVMMMAKETKRITYQLLEENYLVLTELKKPVVSGPNKSFTLFHIQLPIIVRTTIEQCYKILFNNMTRRHHEKFLNKRIIDKKQRVDTITMGMRVQGASSEQLLDIEEMITPPEGEILEKIGKMMKKLSAAELEIDDTIFLLQMYLAYE